MILFLLAKRHDITQPNPVRQISTTYSRRCKFACARVASLDLFARAKNELQIPSVAIGGITLENAAKLKESGADAIAVISALFNAADIAKTSQQFTQLFQAVKN